MIESAQFAPQSPEKQSFDWNRVPKLRYPPSDLEYVEPRVLLREIFDQLRVRNEALTPESLLFCGLDGKQLIVNRGVGERHGTFASTLEETIAEEDLDGRLSPLTYARHTETGIPALAIFDSAKMQKIEESLGRVADLDDSGSFVIPQTGEKFEGNPDHLWVIDPNIGNLNDCLIGVVSFQ
jgi:hypothetical protein